MEDLNIKSNRWCFTSFKKRPTYNELLCVYMVMQREFTMKGALHYQGYVEFKNEYNAKQVSSILKMGRAHVEPPNIVEKLIIYIVLKVRRSLTNVANMVISIRVLIRPYNVQYIVTIASSNTAKAFYTRATPRIYSRK